MDRRKITNVSGDDLIVPWLNGRRVAAGEVVLVAEEDVAAYLCQPAIWEAGDAETLAAYEDVVTQATVALEQAAAQYAEAYPEPWAPEPVPLGADAAVAADEPPAADTSSAPSEVEATPLEAQPAPAAEPAPAPAPAEAPEQTTSAAAEPGPEPEPAAEVRYPPRLQQLLDRTSAPASSALTGSLPAQPRL